MLTKTRCMSLLDDIAGYAHRANIGKTLKERNNILQKENHELWNEIYKRK